VTVCYICGGTLKAVAEEVFDDRYGYPGSFALACCKVCDHRMTLPGLSEDDLPALYSTYYPRKSTDIPSLEQQAGVPDMPAQKLGRWLKGTDNQGQYLTRPGMKVLDYGCGAAVSLLEIQRLGGEAYGIETDPNIQTIADHYGLRIHIGRIDDEPFPGVRFDLIVLNQVVEHLPDPAMLVHKLLARLAPGGRLVMSFPNAGSIYRHLFGIRWINWHVPYHLQHFTRGSFRHFATVCGLRILRERTITPNLWTALQFRAISYPVQCGQPNPLWGVKPSASSAKGLTSVQPNFTFRRKLSNYARALLRKSALPLVVAAVCIVNRCIDTIGFGDSVIVILEPEDK
jgi:2-polyprenyl-3-methyl-5-hydroxy-6-metoxy-1,4-benzoquinol methylase